MRNKLLVLLMMIFLACPVFALNETSTPAQDTNSQMELVQNEVKVEDTDVKPIDTEAVKKSVVPNSHNESKKVFGLFLKTMLAVAICAILLYFILVFVKKFYSSSFMPTEDESIENLDLATPNNRQDAIRSFLNRTK